MPAAGRWRIGFLLALLAAGQAHAFEIPDVRSNGAVTYSFQQQKLASGTQTMQNTITGTVNPSTYIYEPWIATVNSSISLSESASSGDTSQTSTNLTGNVVFNVLPQSDFPVELSYTRFNRTIQLDTEENDLTGQAIRLTSRVNLPDEWAVQTRISADDATDSKNASEVSHELAVDIAGRWFADLFRLGIEHRDAIYTGAESAANGESVSDGASLRYRTQPFETVTSDSTSTARISTVTQEGYTEESTVMQGVTTAIWRPKEVADLVVNGALRTFSQDATITRTDGTNTSSSKSAFGNLATSYVFQPRLVGNFGLNGGFSDNQTKDSNSTGAAPSSSTTATTTPPSTSFTLGGNAGLDYTSEAEQLAGFSWNWNSGGATDLVENTVTGLSWTNSARVGHSGTRTLDMWVVDNANLSLSQATGVGVGNLAGVYLPLSHAATLSHSSRQGKVWDVWHFSASDSRTFGGTNPSIYELVNLQFTQGFDPDRFSSLSGSITFQTARQVFSGTDTGFVDTISGQITYRQRGILGIENLLFTSDLTINPPSLLGTDRNRDLYSGRANSSNSSTMPQGNFFGTQRWTNRLDYIIGQLRTSLIGRITNDTEGMGEMVMFQVSRRF